MQDSEKTQEQQEPKAPVVTEEIVMHSTGVPVVRARGEGGKFVKNKRNMPETREVTRLMRSLLTRAEAGADGKMSRGDRTRFRKMFDNMVRIASWDPEQPLLDKLGNLVVDKNGNPITIKDAKCAMASVQAFKELTLRAYGKPSVSDEEVEALKTHGVKIVVISPMENMVNKEVIEEKPKEKVAPTFIDAEFVDNKK